MRKDNELLVSAIKLEKELIKSKKHAFDVMVIITIVFALIVMVSACSDTVKSAYAINEYRTLFDEFES